MGACIVNFAAASLPNTYGVAGAASLGAYVDPTSSSRMRVLRSAAYAAVVDWCPSDELRGEVWWGASEVERPDMGCGA